ncbi:hypothetical protein J6590_099381 [Homalodisca vitripennis]|nr:hypothetical protein J6590_099381 [Homalodisca vitripennis]
MYLYNTSRHCQCNPRPHRTSTVHASNEPARYSHTDMYNTSRHCQCNHVLTTEHVQSTPVTSQLDIHTRICTTLADIASATTSSPRNMYSPRQTSTVHASNEPARCSHTDMYLYNTSRHCQCNPRPHRTSTVHASNEPARYSHTDMYNTSRHCQYNYVLATGQVQSTPITSQLDVHTRICTTLADIVSAITSSPQGKFSPHR